MAVSEKIRIKIKGYEHATVDAAAAKIVEAAKRSGASDWHATFSDFLSYHFAASLADCTARSRQFVFGIAQRYRLGVSRRSKRYHVSVLARGAVDTAAVYLLYGSGDYLFGSDHVDYRFYDVA